MYVVHVMCGQVTCGCTALLATMAAVAFFSTWAMVDVRTEFPMAIEGPGKPALSVQRDPSSSKFSRSWALGKVTASPSLAPHAPGSLHPASLAPDRFGEPPA